MGASKRGCRTDRPGLRSGDCRRNLGSCGRERPRFVRIGVQRFRDRSEGGLYGTHRDMTRFSFHPEATQLVLQPALWPEKASLRLDMGEPIKISDLPATWSGSRALQSATLKIRRRYRSAICGLRPGKNCSKNSSSVKKPGTNIADIQARESCALDQLRPQVHNSYSRGRRGATKRRARLNALTALDQGSADNFSAVATRTSPYQAAEVSALAR